eukprot:881846-Pelagomonas_calceolata.AAC.5
MMKVGVPQTLKNGPQLHPGTNFHSQRFAVIFFWYKDTKLRIITPLSAVGGPKWRFEGPNFGQLSPDARRFSTKFKCPRFGPTYAGSV